MDTIDQRLLTAQNDRCPLCGGFLLDADHEPQNPQQWEQWLAVTRKAMAKRRLVAYGTPGITSKLRLIHAHCQRRQQVDTGGGPALLPARDPSGLA